jgi:heme oxygenase
MLTIQEAINQNQEPHLTPLEAILNLEQALLDLEVILRQDPIPQDLVDLAQEVTVLDLLVVDPLDHQVQEVVEEEEDNKL